MPSGASVHREIVERAVDHHQQGGDAEGSGQFGDLNDQRMPGLRIHWPQGNICGTTSSQPTMAMGASRVIGTRSLCRIARTMPVKSRKISARAPQKASSTRAAAHHGNPRTLRDIDQPVKAARGFHHAGHQPSSSACLIDGARSTASSMGTAANQASAESRRASPPGTTGIRSR